MRLGLLRFAPFAVAVLFVRPAPAEDLDPPLAGMHELADPTGSVAIQLPTGWTADGPANGVFGSMEHWEGGFWPRADGKPDADIYVRVMPAYSRAALARWGSAPNRRGKVVDGSVRTAAGMIEEVRAEPERRSIVLLRFVEGEGMVFELSAAAPEKIFRRAEGHFRAVLDTFKVVKRPVILEKPAGYVEVPDDSRVVWSDTRDKRTLKIVLDSHAAGRKAMAAMLPGAAADPTKPLLLVCDKDATYVELTALGAATVVPSCSMVDYQRRAVLVRAAEKGQNFFDMNIRGCGERQMCQQWFGGPTEWIEHGLFYLVEGGLQGRGPDKPIGQIVQHARQAVAARRSRLDRIMELRWDSLSGAEAVDAADLETYAWHFFLRYGGGAKTYGARYFAYLDAVRADGDPAAAAAKCFAGVDYDAMKTAFDKWIETWH